MTSLTVLLTARAGDELLSTHLGHADQDHQAALTHAGWGGETLTAWVLVFLVLVVAFWLVASTKIGPERLRHPVVKWVIGGLSVAVSAVLLFLVFMTGGDTGAASVWGGQ